MRTATLVIAALIATGLAGCSSGAPVRSVDLLIVGGTVIDPASGTVAWNSGIAVDDGVIVALHAGAGDFDSRNTIDASDRFIVPAFVDMRSHWDTGGAPEDAERVEIDSRRSLYYGVTRIRDVMPLRTTASVRSPDDVRQEVARLVDAGADAIEIVSSLPPEGLHAAIQAAHEAELPVALHVASADELAVLQAARDNTAPDAITVTGPVDPSLYRQLGSRRFFYVASPNTIEGMADGTALHTRQSDPFLLETLTASEVAALRQDYALPPEEPGRVAGLVSSFDYAREAKRAGAILVTGTDAGSSYTFPGYSIHEELWMLADAGIEPIEVLATATSNAAVFLGKQNNWGSIEAGHAADLLLLKGNPLADIRNTRRIAEVIQDGTIVDRMALLDR